MTFNIDYKMLPYQAQFDRSTKFYDCLFGGYGSGKTYSLVMKLLKLAAINKGLPGGVLVPTLKMFRRDVLPTLRQILGGAKIPFKYVGSEGVIVIPALQAHIWVFHDQDEGESTRGPNLAYGAINEVTLVSRPGFDAFLARIRLKNAPMRQIAMSGTPEGFNWTYDMFVAEPREDSDVFYGDMRLNTHVAEEYAKMLEGSYDDILVQQYVGGKFINTTAGAALYKFDRKLDVVDGIKFNPKLPVWVSLDFNVSPFAATLWNYYPPDKRNRDGVKLKAFDEICIKGGDTWELMRVLKEKTPKAEQIVIFPDPAGNARKTSAAENITDIEILETEFTDLRYNTAVTVRECLLAANAFVGKRQIQIDRKKCKETIKDFEQCILKPGTNNLEKKKYPNRTHWLDGFKNMIEHEYPITVGEGDWRSYQIR